MEFIRNIEKYYGHTKDSEIELLKQHLELSKEYGEKIISNKNLDITFKKLYIKLIGIEGYEDIFKSVIISAIELHDIGKINKSYQINILGNENFEKANSDTNHSKIGSVLYIDQVYNEIKNVKDRVIRAKLAVIIFINAYAISKHHGKLSSFKEYIKSYCKDQELIRESLKYEYDDYEGYILGKKSVEIVEQIFEDQAKLVEEEMLKMPEIDMYIYSKLIYSLITASDFYATSDFNGVKVDDFGYIEDVNKYYDEFKRSSIFEGVRQLRKGKESYFDEFLINKIRTEMFIEAEDNLIQNTDKNIFYLEAPTGSGKTVCSLNLALKSLEINKNINKIFYIFPFNTLVEQTNDSLIGYLKNKEDIVIVNSITPIKEVDKSDELALLGRQFLHYPITLTSHVNFFDILFGTGREETFPMVHLANSVIILDEIQSYRNSIWKEIILFLERFADILNLKIIIMSATLPRLNLLGAKDENFAYLINDRLKYFKNPLFKDRVDISYELLKTDIDLIDFILGREENKILIEFLTVDSATQFYKSLKNYGVEYAELITGNDNKAERKRIIDKIKNMDDKIILVATQVVEAGVDIDMDLGIKDISIIDSEEQFAGRINRSCKKKNCKVYFFNQDNEQDVYKEDMRKNYTLLDEENKKIFNNKDFDIYYSKVINDIEEYKKGIGITSINSFLKKEVGILDFEKIKEHMKLIDKKNLTLFLNSEVMLPDGTILRGDEVWNNYKKLLKSNISYAKKKIEISKMNELIDYFTYQVSVFYKSKVFGEVMNNIIYIGDGEKYLTEDGKFDKALLKESGYDII